MDGPNLNPMIMLGERPRKFLYLLKVIDMQGASCTFCHSHVTFFTPYHPILADLLSEKFLISIYIESKMIILPPCQYKMVLLTKQDQVDNHEND